MPCVYLLRCRDGSLYAGAAMTLEKRLAEHATGKASRYTRSRLPVALVWSAEVESWSAALKEEHRIKRLTRAQKETLVDAAAKPKRVRKAAATSRPRPRARTARGA